MSVCNDMLWIQSQREREREKKRDQGHKKGNIVSSFHVCVCVCVCVCACVNGSFYPDVLSRHTTKIITTITETCKLTLISFLFLNDDTLLVTVDNL